MAIDFQSDIVDAFFATKISGDTNYQSLGLFNLPSGFSDLTAATITTNDQGGGYQVRDGITLSGGSYIAAVRLLITEVAAPFSLVDGVIGAPGSGFTADDILTLSGGTFDSAATLTVDTVNGSGAVLTFHISDAGSYTIVPASSPVPVTGGSGSGFTLNAGWGGAVSDFDTAQVGAYQGVPGNPVGSDTNNAGAGFTADVTWSSAAGQRAVTFIDLFRSYIGAVESVHEAKVISEIVRRMTAALKFGSNFNGSTISNNARADALRLIAGNNLPAPFDPGIPGEVGTGLLGSIYIGTDSGGAPGYLYNAWGNLNPSLTGGLNPLMPAHAPAGVLSFWYNLLPLSMKGGGGAVFTIRDSGGSNLLFQVSLTNVGNIVVEVGDGIQIPAQFTSVFADVKYDGSWHNVQIAWNMGVSSIVSSFLTVMQDVALIQMAKSTGARDTVSSTIPYQNNYYFIGADITNIPDAINVDKKSPGNLPANPRVDNNIAGMIAELWFSPFGTKVEPKPLNMGGTATYVNPTTGLPLISGAYLVRRAPNGDVYAGFPGVDGNLLQVLGNPYPNFGFSNLPLLGAPAIYMHGGSGSFHLNHAAPWSFVLGGGHGKILSSQFLSSSTGAVHTGTSSPNMD